MQPFIARSRAAAAARGALCAVALVLAGCGSDREYDAAVRANTVVGFDDYLRLHPDGSHAAEARAHLAALVEDREWQRAHTTGSVDAYQQYLRGYPSGAHARDALIAIADLNTAAVPNTEASGAAPAGAAAASGPAPATPAVKGPIARVTTAGEATPRPAPPPAAKGESARHQPAARAASASAASGAARPPAATAAAPGTRIQLGAFVTEASATAAWQKLTVRYPELAGRTPLVAGAQRPDGRRVHRLQVGGFSHESAGAMCAALLAKHDACLIVPTGGAGAN